MLVALEKSVEGKLDRVAKQLNDGGLFPFRRGDVSNFTASFGLFSDNIDSRETNQTVITHLLGPNARLEELRQESVEGAIDIIRECLSWPGDDGAHPSRQYLASEEFEADLQGLENEIRHLLSAFSSVSWFSLSDGHPFYPVFWDFAFLCRNDERGLVLVGSSSD